MFRISRYMNALAKRTHGCAQPQTGHAGQRPGRDLEPDTPL